MDTTIETIAYRGFNIDILQDEVPQNPWADRDCEPPLIAWNGWDEQIYGDIDTDTPTLTRQEVKDNLSEILEFCGFPSLLSLCREYSRYIDPVEDCVNKAMNDTEHGIFATLEFAYKCKGVVTLCHTAMGYSQGDCAAILIVATPEWVEKVGATISKPADLMETAELWQSWAFGDVYGYRITEGGLSDSCYGFYGGDHKASGLLDEAQGLIDFHIECQAKQRISRLKALIKNHVPLHYRSAELAKVSKQ